METLKNTKQFDVVYKKGVKVHTKYFILFITNIENQKFGFVTSKKVGIAVKRNRIRRILKEIVRKNIKILNNNSLIFVAKKNIELEDIKYKSFEKDILIGIKKSEKYISKIDNNISKNIKKNSKKM